MFTFNLFKSEEDLIWTFLPHPSKNTKNHMQWLLAWDWFLGKLIFNTDQFQKIVSFYFINLDLIWIWLNCDVWFFVTIVEFFSFLVWWGSGVEQSISMSEHFVQSLQPNTSESDLFHLSYPSPWSSKKPCGVSSWK